RVLRDRQHPTHLAQALLGVNQLCRSDHLQSAFHHPVSPRQTTVEHTVVHVAGHLLCSNQHALNFGIVGGGKVRPAAGVDVESGTLEQRQSRFLQAAFGNAYAQLHRSTSAMLTASGSVKHDLVPLWQTRPSPSTRTRNSKVSRSQSVAAETMRRRFPELSPFIQSFCRVRE